MFQSINERNFFQDDKICDTWILYINNLQLQMRINEYIAMRRNPRFISSIYKPVPETIILIKFIFVKDSIQCFLCTSARLQRPYCTRRFASSIIDSSWSWIKFRSIVPNTLPFLSGIWTNENLFGRDKRRNNIISLE